MLAFVPLLITIQYVGDLLHKFQLLKHDFADLAENDKKNNFKTDKNYM